jgi:uncharacterized protein YqgC (DUF456 family)
MDIFWMIVASIVMLAGIAGSFLPVLPGPPLSYAALWIMQLRSEPPFTVQFLLVFLAITVGVTILDYVIPVYGTKKFGGSKYGVWGSTIGLVVGMFFPPVGLIVGPFLGALAGELLGNTKAEHALRAAVGSFIGFLFGTLLKLITCIIMGYYLVMAMF